MVVVVVVMVGMAVKVVAVDSQSAGHHHALDGAPALVLGHGRAAVVSIGFPGGQRDRKRNIIELLFFPLTQI